MAQRGQSNPPTEGTKGPRLGTRLRGQLAAAYDARGHQRSSLNFVYSPKCDQDLVLVGNLAYGHFLLCEASPEIEKVAYVRPGSRISGSELDEDTKFDAEVTFVTGAVQRRKLMGTAKQRATGRTIDTRGSSQPLDAHAEKEDIVTLTELDIFANPVLIRNWNRVVPWLAQARDRSLYEYLSDVAALVRSEGSVRLSAILSMPEASPAEAALYVAAAFRGIQQGMFQSDMDARPLSRDTWLREREQ